MDWKKYTPSLGSYRVNRMIWYKYRRALIEHDPAYTMVGAERQRKRYRAIALAWREVWQEK